MSWEFILTTLVVVASPGTGAVYTLAAALSGGARAGFVAAFGCTLGIVPHMVAAISGTAALFHASDFAFAALKSAGVGYLLLMAWTMLRSRGALVVPTENGQLDERAVVGKAIVLNLLNPKLSIFFLAFLPQFVEAGEAAPVLRMTALGLGVVGIHREWMTAAAR